MGELLHLLGLIGATILACTFHEPLSRTLAPWFALIDQEILDVVGFLALFVLGLIVFVHIGARMLAKRLVWERMSWAVQGLGLFLGGVRGLWWCGFGLLLLLATGMPYLAESIQERSILSPHLLSVSHRTLTQVVHWSAGAAWDGELIPVLPRR